MSGPLIPKPPPRSELRRPKKNSGLGLLLWPGAFALGAALGAACYQLTGMDATFEYWLALILS